MPTVVVPDTVVFIAAKGKAIVEQWAVEVGETVTPLQGIPAEPAVTFTLTVGDAAELRAGTLDLSAGFMRGQIKMAGDFGVLLRVLPRLRGALEIA